MIRAAVGHSTETSAPRVALEAAQAVTDGLDGASPDWAIAFVTPEHRAQMPALHEALSRALGTPYVVGCTAAGVLAGGREIERGPAVGVLGVASDQLRATPFLFRDDGDQGMTAGVHIGQRLVNSRNSNDLVLVWPDAMHVRPDRLLQGLDAVLGRVPVLGGAASSRGADPATLQFCGGEVSSASVAGLRLGGRFGHVVGITQGCRPLGDPIRVTRSHENLILELDGRPALELLRERAPRGLLENPEQAFEFLFVGLMPDNGGREIGPGDYLIRNIVTSDSDTGVIAVADRIEEGRRIVFAQREPVAAEADMRRMIEQVSSQHPGRDYRFGLYFNCMARGGSFYGDADVDARLLGQAFPDVPILGFFCAAEIGPLGGSNHLFTYTGVLLLVSD